MYFFNLFLSWLSRFLFNSLFYLALHCIIAVIMQYLSSSSVCRFLPIYGWSNLLVQFTVIFLIHLSVNRTKEAPCF